jgi:RNA recognition motif-containing protein
MREERGERSSEEEGVTRANNRKPNGYFHNLDQSAVSFYVTNFPDDCGSNDLRKMFAEFGVVGDVFIPKKVYKWGKRFAFVKFLKVKVVEELAEALLNVWCGSFKLRVNKSWFGRDEEKRKKPEKSEISKGGRRE